MRTPLHDSEHPAASGSPVAFVAVRALRAVAAVLVLVLAAAGQGLAQDIASRGTTSAQPSLLPRAQSMARSVASPEDRWDLSTVQVTPQAPRSRKHLVWGVVGIGTAVAGALVYQGSDDSSNLPGITNGRRTTGFVMMGAGAAIGIPSLIKAFR